MEKRTIALLKVHSTVVLFGLSGIFDGLIESSTEVRAVFVFLLLWLFSRQKGINLAN